MAKHWFTICKYINMWNASEYWNQEHKYSHTHIIQVLYHIEELECIENKSSDNLELENLIDRTFKDTINLG